MRSRHLRALFVCAALLTGTYAVLTAVALSTTTAANQNFDAMGVPSSATTASPLPVDFRVDNPSAVRTVGSFSAAGSSTARGGGANLSSSAANGIYNFGGGTASLGNTDRAVGFLSSGTATASGNLYGQFTNNTGGALSGLTVSYAVEKYRQGINPAGFCVQLYYSSNGTQWTNAGPSFLTTFAVDAGPTNSGYATAPGAVQSVNQILSVSVPDGANVFLGWNYSVCGATTTTNAQALAIDDINVTGIAAGDDAPTVTSSAPAAGATTVPLDSNVVINFSENVNATAGAFTLQCPTGSAQVFGQSASPSGTFTLDPTSDLPSGATCTVTVIASQITDTDTTDPPDQMASDFTFSFSTALPETAPAVTSTTPASSASNVPVNSTIVISFSESVGASASAFDVQCPTGAPQAFAQSASPNSSFTLTPTPALPPATTCTVTVTAGQVTDTDANDPPDSMASDFTFSFTTANPPPPGATNVIINEVDADTPGPDAAEFAELYDGGVGNTPLDGLVVVFYNGNGDVSYAAFDLDGYTTDANGYFTLGNPGVPGVDLVFDPGDAGLMQNGADAVALYVGNATDFPNGTSVTTANLQDAVAYDTDDADDPGLLALLNADQPQVNENGGGSGTIQSSQRCPNGSGGARNTSTYGQGTPTPDVANTCPVPPPPNNSPIVISQLYGGGGNSGATYQRDYVELFNRGTTTVDMGGWSLQYASASGSGWDFSKQPLGGTIAPGQYYLIALASGANGAPVPPANISGQINMSGTNGKVALVDSFDGLVGNCPTANPHVMDFVGYGSGADCREGATTAPGPSNTTSIFRLGGGSTDTNNNGGDFVTGAPAPRRTAPIVELGPLVLSTDPAANGTNAARDATIQVTFTEPVDVVVGSWFDLTCAGSGQHSSATFAGAGQNHYITPNVNFVAGELCTVTIFKDQVHDQDLDDSGANTDTLPANYVWSFRIANGTLPPFPASVHLTMGNPSGAIASTGQPNNYLMEKAEYALSYARDLGRPNWVSWHLSGEWIGTLTRVDSFRPDPEVPPDWYRVQSFDFAGTGFDRGHMVPNADRDQETSIPINQATFLMSNMLAQAPDNNQGPWASFENYLRTLTPAEEIYIVAGGVGAGGVGSNGGVTMTLAGGHVTVPVQTWKVALVIPAGSGDDISRVSCSSRTIAVIMPNTQGIRNDPWENFLTNVDAVETLTGYDLFSNLPEPVQRCVEAGINGNNTKNNQSITFAPLDPRTFGEADFPVGATASSELAVNLSILSGPATIFGGTVHLTGPGTVTIRAAQPGNENFNPAADADRSFEVAKAGQTIDFAAPADRTYGDSPFTVSATGGGSGNAVTFTASGACASAGVNGTTITVVSAGSCTITASQAGSESYDAATDVVRTLAVNKTGATIVVTGYSDVYDGASHGATGSARGVGGEDLSGLLHLGATFTNAPGGTAHWTFDGNANYNPASDDVTITIAKKGATITAADNGKTYGSADPALTYQVTSGGLVTGDSFSGSLTRVAGEAVGTYAILQGTVALSGNYTLSYVGATLTIGGALGNKAEVLAQMRALRATVTDKQDGKKLDDAIERLADSLHPALWRNPADGVRLDARDGDKAIGLEKQAVEKLEELIKSKKSTISDTVLQGFVTRITAMDRLLAVVAIADAQAAGGDDRKIQEALRQLQHGDARVSDGKWHEGIDRYQDAWKLAQHALKKA